MNILSIGNSFSVDAQAHIPGMAKAGGDDIYLGNLYIGGCSLETHMNNVSSDAPAYQYFVNNDYFGYSSIKTALSDRNWDYITVQQASHFSGIRDTYYPYIIDLADYARTVANGAEVVVFQTWAYEFDSAHAAFENYGRDRFQMHKRIAECIYSAAKAVNARVIPVGNAVSRARENARFDPERGGTPLTRDGFHLSLTLGRFLAGAVWYEFFTSRDCRKNAYAPEVYEFLGHDTAGNILKRPLTALTPDASDILLLREIAHETVNNA